MKRPLTSKQLWGRVTALERLAAVKGAKFDADTPEKRADRRARAMLDPSSFDLDYLPHYFPQAPAPFHRELYRIVEEERLAAVEAPRGHAKTTVITFAYSLRQATIAAAVRDWNEGRLAQSDPLLHAALVRWNAPAQLRFDPFIVIGSCTRDQAADFTASIKVELEGNDRIIGDWGELVSDPGENYQDFTLRNDVRILSAGMRKAIRGVKHRQWRPTLWIIDDPDDAATVGSERVREKQLRYVTRTVRPAIEPVIGRVLVIANETHPECVVAQIYRDQFRPTQEQRFTAWAKFRFQAIDDATGEILWEERFPRSYLLELRQEDPEGFETEYQNNPASGRAKPFTVIHTYSRTEVEGRELPTVLVMDPALGHTRTSDFQAIVVMKRDGNRLLIWRAWLLRMKVTELRHFFLEVYRAERPDIAGIESVGFQELLITMVNEIGDEDGLFPGVRPIPQHEAKDLRILSLVALNDAGVLLFPDDGTCRPLEMQFLRYPDGKRDGPDVTQMAVKLIRETSRSVDVRGIRHKTRRSGFAFGVGTW